MKTAIANIIEILTALKQRLSGGASIPHWAIKFILKRKKSIP